MAMREIRTRALDIDAARVETDDDAPNGRIVGYAAVFDQPTRIGEDDAGELFEVIRPGAFDAAIAESQDVPALIEHDRRLILARTRAGTLRLSTDDYGLRFEIDLPDTTRARDLRADVRAGNYAGASFGYLPRPGGETITNRSEDGRRLIECEVTSADLYDVSIVVVPAFPGTAVETRSKPQRIDLRARRKRLVLLTSRARLAALKHHGNR